MRSGIMRLPVWNPGQQRYSLDASKFSQLRSKVEEHFARRFWNEEGGYLYDVVDVEGVAGQNDASLRPNQLFAASLTPSLLTENQRRSILQKVTEPLLTPLGLRSLSPDDPSYCKHYNGNQQQRDGAYHRGTVWQWLIGPYVDVHLSIYKDHAAIRDILQPLVQHLWDACLGTISEIAEPEPPFTQVGCFAQAWSVAEVSALLAFSVNEPYWSINFASLTRGKALKMVCLRDTFRL